MSDRQIRSRFLDILDPPSSAPGSRIKNSSDISDQAKRLRRLVLTAGIPDEVRTTYPLSIKLDEMLIVIAGMASRMMLARSPGRSTLDQSPGMETPLARGPP